MLEGVEYFKNGDLHGQSSRNEQEAEEHEESFALSLPDIAWRGPFSLYREAMRGTTEASDAYHFCSLWVASAVRLRRRVWFPYGMDLYPNVDIAIFGPTGDRKTTAARGAIKLLDNTNTKILQGSGSGEGLADWLNTDATGSPPSHFLFLEELSELLARGKWDGATLIPFLTRVFDCPDKYETNYRKNPIALVNPTLSILACTTSEVFWQYIRDLDIRSGFVNRFLLMTGEGKEPIALPAKPSQENLQKVTTALSRLDTLTPQESRFSPQATELWKQFYSAWRKTELDSLVKASTERIPAYVLKLAMVYAALEQTIPSISEDQLKAATAVGRYATKCTEQLMSQHRQGSVQARCEDTIRRVLKDTPRQLSRRNLWQRVSGRFDSGMFSKALYGMTLAGELEVQGGERKGQTLYRLAGKKNT
jgi:hypothetical protein